MQSAAAQSYILDILSRELPPNISYHDISHTEKVIMHAALLADAERVSGKQLEILLTAAAYHDAGFLEVYIGHEEVSCRIARESLPQFHFSEEDIESICSIIMATKLPQSPQSHLAQILCDADLYYLGTDDYTLTAESLFLEFLDQKIVNNKYEWQEQQVQFLMSHRYFTKTAINHLSAKQDKNLIVLQASIESPHTIKNHESNISDILLILFGVIITSFALKGFLMPNHFFDGGITGISLLIHEVYDFPLGYVIVLANLPFIAISFFSINKGFAFKTFFTVVLLGLCLLYPEFPVITNDKLLISIFGGFFLGVGIGLTMRAGCAVDGIEVLALYTLRRSSFTISEIILGINIIIFSLAATQFGIQTALYSMLTYFTASQTIDYVIEGMNAFTGVTIISGKSELIKFSLVNDLKRGITIYKGERGYLPGKFDVHDDCDIIFTVISRLELRKLKNMVTEIDPNAFVFASTIKETSGGIIRKRHLH
jgi:uncharacterized membrane-anchored protein YitT (DUF2179 family)/predicted metal-dependent HD superfamily phosphohydrolase